MDGYSAFLVLEDFVSMLEDEGREPRRGLREYMRRLGGYQNGSREGRRMSHEPIAYTYEADYHCPACTEARFGRGKNGFIAEDAVDGEGNPVGVVAPWDEWCDPDGGYQELVCGTCGSVIDTCGEADLDRVSWPEAERIMQEWLGSEATDADARAVMDELRRLDYDMYWMEPADTPQRQAELLDRETGRPLPAYEFWALVDRVLSSDKEAS